MQTFTHDDYQILERKRVFQGYFAIDQLTIKHRLFDGSWSNEIQRELFERGSVAAVLLYDPNLQKVLLLEQFRVGALASEKSPWMFEIVAGIIEHGESVQDVAIREAEEEAGQKISDLIEIGSYFATPGGSSERLTLYCAKIDASDAEGIYGLKAEDEDIRVFTMDLEEVKKALDEGVFENATSLIALQWLLLNCEKVHKIWNISS